jgi:hypothetical protein
MRLAGLIGTLLAVLAAAATCATADGGGSSPGTTAGGPFSLGPGGMKYTVAPVVPAGPTIVKAVRGDRTMRSTRISGRYGIPLVTLFGSMGGLSRDGRTLVLPSATGSRFAVLDAHTLRFRQLVVLDGQFSYDALSPGGRTLYLIQHVASCCSNRYYVRAYDLRLHRLLTKVIFDTREKWGLMSGYPVSRATGAAGRWVYTLYTRPGGKPFVHALDSVHRSAVCVDLPWTGSQNPLYRMRLSLSGHKLMLRSTDGRTVRTLDTKTFRVT